MPSVLRRQAWRKKLAINFIIWFIRACAIFVIVFLGLMICPTAFALVRARKTQRRTSILFGLDSAMPDSQWTRLRNLFLIGMVDNCNSPQCQFVEGILLASQS